MPAPADVPVTLELSEADLALALDAVELWGEIARGTAADRASDMTDQAEAAADLAARLRGALPADIAPSPAAVEARRMLARTLVSRLR